MEPLTPKTVVLTILRFVWAGLKPVCAILFGILLIQAFASFFSDDS